MNLANAMVDWAAWRSARGGDPAPLLERSARHLEAFREVYPTDYWFVWPKHLLVQAEVQGEGAPEEREALLRRAVAATEELLGLNDSRVDSLWIAARARRKLAAARMRRGQDPGIPLARGLEYVERALENDPDHRPSLAEKALSTELLARTADSPEVARRHREEARRLAAKAAEGRADLARELGELLDASAD